MNKQREEWRKKKVPYLLRSPHTDRDHKSLLVLVSRNHVEWRRSRIARKHLTRTRNRFALPLSRSLQFVGFCGAHRFLDRSLYVLSRAALSFPCGEKNRKTTTETVSIARAPESGPRRSRLDRDYLQRTVFVQTSSQPGWWLSNSPRAVGVEVVAHSSGPLLSGQT